MFPTQSQVKSLNAATKRHFDRNSGETEVDWEVSDHFLAEIRMSSPGAGPKYSDARYEWVHLQPDNNQKHDDELATIDDPIDTDTFIGTNLAEIGTGSHGVRDGEIVCMFKVTIFVSSPVVVYYFYRELAIRFAKATAAWTTPSGANSVTATECYENGTLATGAVAGALTLTIVSPSTDLPQPNTHIAIGDVLAYMPTGANAGRLLPVGVKSDDTAAIGSTDETVAAATDHEDNAERKTVTLTKLYRMGYVDTDGTPALRAYYRDEVFVCGILHSVSVETAVVIDTPTVDCP